MGMIKFALKGSYKRYYKNLKKLAKENHKNANLMFIDTVFSTIFLKSGMQDYLNYKFYDKSYKERKEYATIGYQNDFYKIAQECIDSKPSFAIEILLNSDDDYSNWNIPSYIKEGLEWLKK